MKRSLTSIMAAAAMLVAANVNAGEVYFFSPNGSGDGYSWEDAMSGDELETTIKGAASGDIIYLMEGTYTARTSGVFEIPFGVTIKGGYPASSTGENVDITYPTGAETILDADLDGDGVGDNGTKAFIYIAGNEEGYYTDVDPIVIEGVTIKNARVGSDTEKVVNDYTGAALYCDNANLTLGHVKFENNVRVGDITQKWNRGTIAVARGSYVYAHDCVWENNEGQSAGVCFSMRQRGGNTTQPVEEKEEGYTIFERCYFSDTNHMEDVTTTNNRYGGVVTLSDGAGTMVLNNCTAHGKIDSPIIHSIGAFCRVGGYGKFYMTNTTLINYYAYDAANLKGIISFGTNTKSYLANNIVVNTTDTAADDNGSVMWFQANTSVYESAGYNVCGSTFDPLSKASLKATDSAVNTNTVATVFGADAAVADGVIAPLESFRTVPTADLAAAVAAWGLGDKIDVTVDQKGNKRTETTVPGAYDAKASSGIEDIVVESNAEVIAVEYYNVQGQRLNAAPENGLYIQKAIKADGTVKASKLVK